MERRGIAISVVPGFQSACLHKEAIAILMDMGCSIAVNPDLSFDARMHALQTEFDLWEKLQVEKENPHYDGWYRKFEKKRF